LAILNRGLDYLNNQAIKTIGMLITGVLAAIIAVCLLGPLSANIEGITIRAGLAPSSSGVTELRFPPFGVITARTHQGPVKLYLALEQIDSDSLAAKIKNPPNGPEFVRKMQKSIQGYAYRFALRQLLLALLIPLLTILIVWRCPIKTALLQSLLIVVLLSLPVVYSVLTYDPQAFDEPEYQGVIGMAPSVTEFASKSLNNLQLIKQNTDLIITNLRQLFLTADNLPVMAAPEEQSKAVKVLLVGDLHSNPVGVEFIKSAAERFRVNFVINTGDLTDLGTATETKLINGLQQIQVPHLLVAGNHDSPETIKIVSGFSKVQVLNGEMTVMSGLKILGFSDPLASVSAFDYPSEQEAEEAKANEALLIKGEIENQGRPDILVVHNANLGSAVMSLADLTVAGHDHKLGVKQQGRALFIDPGTAGAAGLRGLYSEDGEYSAVIAYLVPGSGVFAMDLIEYNPGSNQFSLQRKMIKSGVPQ